MGFHAISDRILLLKLHCNPLNLSILHVYAQTGDSTEEKIKEAPNDTTYKRWS